MSIDYSSEIKKKEAEGMLYGQQNAMMNCETEILRCKQKIDKYTETIDTLKTEIEKTKEKLRILQEEVTTNG